MSQEIFHSIILIFTIALSFSLVKTPFYQYDLQITALIFIVYFLTKKIFSQQSKNTPTSGRQLEYKQSLVKTSTPSTLSFSFNYPHQLLDSVIFTLLILNIVNSTGATKSPLFFLNYFLIFALSLILEPIISITTALTLVIFYLFSLPENPSIKELIPIFSLPFLTPFALFLGQEHIKNEKLKAQGSRLKNIIAKNQEESFLFLSLILKNHIKTIKEAVENFMGDHELHQIKKSVHRMEKLIEEYEKTN